MSSNLYGQIILGRPKPEQLYLCALQQAPLERAIDFTEKIRFSGKVNFVDVYKYRTNIIIYIMPDGINDHVGKSPKEGAFRDQKTIRNRDRQGQRKIFGRMRNAEI